MPSTLPAPIDKLAIVVVTYKRQELLANLFDSMTELTATPWRIVIVDNENSRETKAMCAAFNERLANLWGTDIEQPDAKGGTDRVIYAPQLENGGGAGGFSAGTKCAYDLGAQWFCVMGAGRVEGMGQYILSRAAGECCAEAIEYVLGTVLL